MWLTAFRVRKNFASRISKSRTGISISSFLLIRVAKLREKTNYGRVIVLCLLTGIEYTWPYVNFKWIELKEEEKRRKFYLIDLAIKGCAGNLGTLARGIVVSELFVVSNCESTKSSNKILTNLI